MQLYSISTIIALPMMLGLAIYGSARKHVWSSKSKKMFENVGGHTNVSSDKALKKTWVRWRFYIFTSGVAILSVTLLIMPDLVGPFSLIKFLFFSIIAYPLVLLGAYLHGVLRKYKKENSVTS